MKIKSTYYDVIDYLQDFSDERIWSRTESTVFAKGEDLNIDPIKWNFWKDHNNRPYPHQFIRDLSEKIFVPHSKIFVTARTEHVQN